jgi:cytidylate kinase
LGIGVPNLKDEIFEVQKNLIRDFASKDSCIIVGRCAEGILSDFENRLSVYIYAPYEARLKNCTDILQMDLKTAKRMIKEIDAARENYHKIYCPNYTSPFDYRDIMLDSSRFGIEGTAMVIAEIVRKRWQQD